MAEFLVTTGEAVGREIARRIRTIVLPSGMRIAVTAVTRSDRNPVTEPADVFVTVQESSDRFRLINTCGTVEVTADVPIVVAVDRAVEEEKPLALRDLWARIYLALMRDRGVMSGTMNRLVTSIEPVDMIPSIPGPESPRMVARIGFRVRYEFPTGDPTFVPSDFAEVDP